MISSPKNIPATTNRFKGPFFQKAHVFWFPVSVTARAPASKSHASHSLRDKGFQPRPTTPSELAREKVKSIDADLGTWTSQEVRFSAGKGLGSVGYNRYNPNIPHL